MYAPPQTIPTTVHATVPDELLLTDEASRFTRELFHGRKIGSFL